MSRVIVLDSSPVGLLTQRRGISEAEKCRAWLRNLTVQGVRVILPEIIDYEIRRELLRAKILTGVSRLDALAADLEYLPLSTASMRRAAELWAQARQQGQPTAGDRNLDADMILIAQTLILNEPDAVIATANIRHLDRFVSAELWENIAP